MNRFDVPDKFGRRLAMCLTGVLLCSFAVGFFKCSLFGVDPFQCFSMGTWGFFTDKISYGLYYSILNILFLAAVLLLNKHYIGIATLINLFLTGYIADFAWETIGRAVPDPTLLQRIGLLGFGVILMCFAGSLYMTADLGVSVYDAIPIIISERTGRIITDFIIVAIGTACVLCGSKGQYPGLGTVISALFMGPLIDFFNRRFSGPLLEGRLIRKE